MPVYSYVCEKCGVRFLRKTSYENYGAAPVNCPKCGSAEVRRRIGRPRMLRGEGADLANIDNPDELAEDPRAMARMMRQMGDETGEELGPEFDEVVNRLEKGQNPEDIERELPDIGMGADGLGGEDEF
ncbi:MAG: FmdB family zinc ribbon protein [Anaerolineales bacterium]